MFALHVQWIGLRMIAYALCLIISELVSLALSSSVQFLNDTLSDQPARSSFKNNAHDVPNVQRLIKKKSFKKCIKIKSKSSSATMLSFF